MEDKEVDDDDEEIPGVSFSLFSSSFSSVGLRLLPLLFSVLFVVVLFVPLFCGLFSLIHPLTNH